MKQLYDVNIENVLVICGMKNNNKIFATELQKDDLKLHV